MKFRNDNLGLSRNNVQAALSSCKDRVVKNRGTEDQQAVDSALAQVSGLRSDIADRRGDGRTGGTLLRFQFGNRQHLNTKKSGYDRESVKWRVREDDQSAV